jgi:8-oxo-dGTP pyrophosphatase MutT (NUDIX family)
MDKLIWKELDSKQVLDCRIFTVHQSHRVAPDGRQGHFTLLKSRDWVNIVPVVVKQGQPCFLMVRQYRHGVDSVTVEFPAGLVEPGETPQEAAARELLEETGYRAETLTAIGKIRPNPAFMDNWCHTFYAEKLNLLQEPDLDHLELLDSQEVALGVLEKEIGTDPYTNAMTMTAWLLYKRRHF